MGYQKEREEFFSYAAQWGIRADDARALLRDAATIQRWATEECNGTIQRDEQDDDKPYRVWPRTTERDIRSKHPIRDMDAHAQARITKRLEPLGLKATYGGDPRGYCVRIFKAETLAGDIESGRERGLGVPARG